MKDTTPKGIREHPFPLGDWLIEPMYHRIVCADASVRVRPRAMDILVHLRMRTPHVVGANELIERFWAHTYTGDAAVHHIIAELRKALGDDCKQPRYIETIPKRGYRLIEQGWAMDGDLTLTAASNVAGPRVSNAVKHSLAVLPFDNICSNRRDDHFADGLHDEIILRLARSSKLQVTSRTSVRRFREVCDASLPDIAAMLCVRYVLEGTVRLLDRRVRITVQLIDAQNDYHLWAKAYDRNLGDVFDVQSDVAEDIADNINADFPDSLRY
jgi:TolB-like protein